ncbi:MAG: M48 family metallopeptidase [Magnetococcales bacterium]|nr:M48 family metallopeptidase [Magnetococcales bacterium]
MTTTIHQLVLSGLTVPYALSRHPLRKRLALRVTPEGMIEARAPQRMSQATVERFLREQATWLHEQLLRIRSQPPAHAALADGASVPLLDTHLVLRVAGEGVTRSRQVGDALWLPAPLSDNGLEMALERWYRRRAAEYLPARLAHWAGIIGVTWSRVTIRGQTGRWGSCSNRGAINLNWRLMGLPSRLVDYVLVHELCHRFEMNHSPAFWARVAAVLPDWSRLRHALHSHPIHPHAASMR